MYASTQSKNSNTNSNDSDVSEIYIHKITSVFNWKSRIVNCLHIRESTIGFLVHDFIKPCAFQENHLHSVSHKNEHEKVKNFHFKNHTSSRVEKYVGRSLSVFFLPIIVTGQNLHQNHFKSTNHEESHEDVHKSGVWWLIWSLAVFSGTLNLMNTDKKRK